nr:uncharacterized protein LOC124806095 isoform X2 [Hydra vulgaris]
MFCSILCVFENNKTQNELECKNEVNKLINGNRVKRIIHNNGSVENHGCTKKTPQCREKAFFNFKLMKRINTPPCCREKVLKILYHFTNKLKLLHVSHMLAFGSVLGWARNGKMIPYDNDIDLIIDKTFWNTTLFFDVLKILEIKHGHRTFFADKGLKLTIRFSKINGNTIDVWPFEIKKHEEIVAVEVPHNDWIKQPLENLFPEQYVNFDNIMTFIPRDPERYLNILYKDWKSELDCSYIVNNKCSKKNIRSKSKLVKFIIFYGLLCCTIFFLIVFFIIL